MPEIIAGRDWEDLKKYGTKGTITIGKNIVGTGAEVHLTTPIMVDVLRPHVVVIVGKRGTGKSYTSQIFAEEMTKLPDEVRLNLCVISIDTQGIFWTMRYPNHKQRDLLYEWGLKPESFEAFEYVPVGHVKKFEEMGVIVDGGFSFRPNDLNANDWCYTFGLAENDLDGILLSRVVNKMQGSYSITDIVEQIRKEEFDDKIRVKLENMFLNANDWGIFSQDGMDIYEFLKPGKVVIFDVSMFGGGVGWNVKSLVVGLLMKKVYEARVLARREEELATIEDSEDKKRKVPLCWLMTDEAHNFIPSEGSTASSDIILTIIRQGRQPGISQLFITQMPDKLHPDVLAQADVVISHRLTSQRDIDALKAIMQTYMLYSIEKYLDELPKLKGVALILDDNSERMYKIRVRPRQSWHGGESPVAL
ncbi:MAG: ATP-binding protein [Candidatus Aenigmarchaeota archaeon]|nr:ATP-binding protein [Candidatus Aenigmarchaeota archaeon]